MPTVRRKLACAGGAAGDAAPPSAAQARGGRQPAACCLEAARRVSRVREGPSRSVGGGRKGPLKCTRRRHLSRLRFAAAHSCMGTVAPLHSLATRLRSRLGMQLHQSLLLASRRTAAQAAQPTACLLAFRLKSAEAFKCERRACLPAPGTAHRPFTCWAVETSAGAPLPSLQWRVSSKHPVAGGCHHPCSICCAKSRRSGGRQQGRAEACM